MVALLLGSTGRPRRLDSRTAGEREALQLMAEGPSDLGIATVLHPSVKTVETHVDHILDTLRIAPPEEHRHVLGVVELLRAAD